jgi:hypothetical protein
MEFLVLWVTLWLVSRVSSFLTHYPSIHILSSGGSKLRSVPYLGIPFSCHIRYFEHDV